MPKRPSEVTVKGIAMRKVCLQDGHVAEPDDKACRWCGGELVSRRVYQVECACTLGTVYELDDEPAVRADAGARFCPRCGTGFAQALHEGARVEGEAEPRSILVGGVGR